MRPKDGNRPHVALERGEEANDPENKHTDENQEPDDPAEDRNNRADGSCYAGENESEHLPKEAMVRLVARMID
jgi:hypothetical protein